VRDLAALTADDFEAAVGTTFDVACPETEPTEIRLESVARGPERAGSRQPFALHFRGAPSLGLDQGIHLLVHPVLGELEIFLVPVGADTDGRSYEAVFN
jgi:hypothetical protein